MTARLWSTGAWYEMSDGRRFILLSVDFQRDQLRVTWEGGLHDDVDVEDVRDARAVGKRDVAPLGGVLLDWEMPEFGGEA